jgi:ribosomal protein L11 methyltransferase
VGRVSRVGKVMGRCGWLDESTCQTHLTHPTTGARWPLPQSGSELKTYPAIDVRGDPLDLVLAFVDDFGPTAVEERGSALRVFFATPDARDRACSALSPRYEAQPVQVSDEDWARRSQANLEAVRVGRITIVPSPDWRPAVERNANLVALVIQPSMGFGTGHHATTRLCLTALQRIGLNRKSVLDVGTGSGVLAIAAARLGAACVTGIDNDPDAIQSARENLTLNPAATCVHFEMADLTASPLPAADVVTANLTRALLARAAPGLAAAVCTDGVLIVSGILTPERDEVCRAFAPASVIWEQEEEGWLGLALSCRS